VDTAIHQTECPDSELIPKPIVDPEKCRRELEFDGTIERQAAHFDVTLALQRIEFDPRGFECNHKKIRWQARSANKRSRRHSQKHSQVDF